MRFRLDGCMMDRVLVESEWSEQKYKSSDLEPIDGELARSVVRRLRQDPGSSSTSLGRRAGGLGGPTRGRNPP